MSFELNSALESWFALYGNTGRILFSVFSFILGACFGSFLTACTWRIPRGKSILWPGSACPVCGHRITPLENIPILSYLMLHAKCSGCGTHISSKYIKLELASALLFTLTGTLQSVFRPDFMLGLLPVWILIVFSLASAWTDWEMRIIPDGYTYPAMILGFLAAWFMGGVNGLIFAGIGFAAAALFASSVALAGKILYKRDAFGWGDVKFLMAAGTLTGIFGVLEITFGACVLTLGWVICDRVRRGRFRKTVPFGPFLAGASILLGILRCAGVVP